MDEQVQLKIGLETDSLINEIKNLTNEIKAQTKGIGDSIQNNIEKGVDGTKPGQKISREMAGEAKNGGSEFAKVFGANLLAGLASSGIQAGIQGLIGGVQSIGSKMIQSAAQTETMGVALKTALGGNAELAQTAQKSITDFAAKTPYELSEVMSSFIKLKNMGLDPGEEALTSYGDTASAMGKSLNDMTEAVADAATGEFERLKEFGIRSASEGDKVKFTFKGVTTEVGKNSEEIQRYLINLGKTNFAGGMEAQSKTFSGMMSTLSDTVSIALSEIAQKSGLLDGLKFAISKISDFIGNNKEIIIGGLKSVGDAVKILFTGDYSGDMFGGQLGEDSPIIDTLFKIREAFINTFDAGKLLFTGDFSGDMFGGQLGEDSPLINGILTIRENIGLLSATIGGLVAGGLIASLIGGFTALTAAIAAAGGVAAFFGGLVATIFSPVVLIVGAVALAAAALYLAWTTNFMGIQEIAQQVMQGVIMPALTQLQNAFNQLIPALMNLWNVVGPVLLPALQTLGAILGGIFVGAILITIGVITGLVNILTVLVNTATNVFNQIKSAVEPVINSVIAKLNEWGITTQTVQMGISIAFIAIQGYFTTLQAVATAVFTFISSIFTNFLTFVGSFVSGVIQVFTGLLTFWDGVFKGDVNRIMEGVTQVINGFKTGWVDAGKNLVMGIIEGVKNSASQLYSSVKDMANNAVKAAKDALQIKSPSRVMMEVGQYVGEGMTVGIQNSTGGVIQASQNMANSAISGATGALAGIGTANFGVSSISTVATGQSQAQPIAPAVSQPAQPIAPTAPAETTQADPSSLITPITESATGANEQIDSLIEKIKTGLSTAISEGAESIGEAILNMDEKTTEVFNMVNENWISISQAIGQNVINGIIQGLSAGERMVYSAIASLETNALKAVNIEVKAREEFGDEGRGAAMGIGSVLNPNVQMIKGFKSARANGASSENNSKTINIGNITNNNNTDTQAMGQLINAFA